MQYVHKNLQISAKNIADRIAYSGYEKSVSLFCCILNFKDIISHFTQYLRYIDYLSLKRVSKYLPMDVLHNFYKLDLFTNFQLKGENLLDIADKTNTVISGSFVLKILLSTPYQVPLWIENNPNLRGDNWEIGDIDLYSHRSQTHTCPICETTVYGVSAISLYLCNGLKWSYEKYRGHTTPNNIHYDYSFSTLFACNICTINNTKYNDMVLKDNIDIGQFIKNEFDFDFCKNYYKNGKLYIACPESVLKEKCIYQIKYYGGTGMDDTENDQDSRILNQEKTLIKRHRKYRERGFNIELQVSKHDKPYFINFYNNRNKLYMYENHKWNSVIDVINEAIVIE